MRSERELVRECSGQIVICEENELTVFIDSDLGPILLTGIYGLLRVLFLFTEMS